MLLYDIEVYLTFSEDFSREKPDRVHLFLVIARLVYVHNMHVTLMIIRCGIYVRVSQYIVAAAGSSGSSSSSSST